MNASAHLRLDAYFGSKRTRPLNEFFYLALSIELREVIPPPKLVPLFFKLWEHTPESANVPLNPWMYCTDPILIYLGSAFETEPNTCSPAPEMDPKWILKVNFGMRIRYWTFWIHFWNWILSRGTVLGSGSHIGSQSSGFRSYGASFWDSFWNPDQILDPTWTPDPKNDFEGIQDEI